MNNPAISLLQDLPKTSYYKLMDWWLLFSVNCLVYSMGVHTYLASVIKEEADKEEAKAAANADEETKSTAWEDSSKPTSAASPAEARKEKKLERKRLLMEKFNQGKRTKPEWVNQIGKIGFIVINVVSNLVIGIIALVEYLKEPDDYLAYDH